MRSIDAPQATARLRGRPVRSHSDSAAAISPTAAFGLTETQPV